CVECGDKDTRQHLLDSWFLALGNWSALKSESSKGETQMARTGAIQLQKTIDEQRELIDQISSLVSDALYPVLSREEVIEKLQEISDLLPEEEEEEEETEDE